jgi:hypothetical protein
MINDSDLFKKILRVRRGFFFLIQTGAIFVLTGKQKKWLLENRSYQQGN